MVYQPYNPCCLRQLFFSLRCLEPTWRAHQREHPRSFSAPLSSPGPRPQSLIPADAESAGGEEQEAPASHGRHGRLEVHSGQVSRVWSLTVNTFELDLKLCMVEV